MNKRFAIGIVSILILALAGCASGNPESRGTPVPSPMVSRVPEMLVFDSLDEFLNRHDNARKSLSENMGIELDVGFVSLDTLYLPSGIPETYRLARIEVYKTFIRIEYWPEDQLSTDHLSIRGDGFDTQIHFQVMRWDLDSPLDGIIEQNSRRSPVEMINDSYFFAEGSNTLHWAFGRTAMNLLLPQYPSPGNTGVLSAENSVDGRIVYDDVWALAPFTEVMVIDLRDEASVAEARAAFRN